MTWVVTAVVVVAGAVTAKNQREAGKQQRYEYERQAEQETVAAEGRELERRQQLNRALSANMVGQSISGISGEGTPQSIALESAKNVGVSEGMAQLSDRLRAAALRRQGAYADTAGRMAATSTMLNTAAAAAKTSGNFGGNGGE